MSDPIERQDVLNLIRKTHMPEEISMQFLYRGVKELPTIEERKTGKWIVDDVGTEHCSVCKHRFYISALFAVGGNDEPPCCPNCGARMEE